MKKHRVEQSSTFEKVDGLQVIVEASGVYRQVDVYKKSGVLYASQGSGFVTLKQNNSTSKLSMRWIDFVLTDDVVFTYKMSPVGFIEVADND